MADFFNNLLLRSSAAAKTSGAVLQPRLPSLFESTHSADELPAPHADTVLQEALAPQHGDDASHTPEQSRNQNIELAAQPSTVRAAQLEHPVESSFTANARRKEPEVPDAHEKSSGPAATPSPGQPARALHRTVRTAQPVEPQRTVLALSEQNVFVRPAPAETDSGPTLGRNDQSPQAESRLTSPNSSGVGGKQTEGHPSMRPTAQRVAQPVLENHPVEQNTIRPRPDDARPTAPVLKPVLAVPLAARPVAAQAPQEQERESIVQIHIGRIDVRAVTTPVAPRITQVAAAQPKMSLDDYLRQREEKR